jgi:outer membrane protein TolC
MNTPVAQYQWALTIWVQPVSTEAAYIVAQKSKELQTNQLRLNVETTYYNVLKAQKNLAIKRENLKYFQDQLKIAQTGYKIGTRARVDVTVAESAVAAYQALVVTEENRYRANIIDLNRLMGLELDTPLKLTSQLNLDKISAKIDVNATVEDALENNVSILRYKKNLEVAKATAEVARRFSGPGIPVYITSEIDARIAEVNVSKESLLITAAIKKSYLSLLTLEQSIDWQTKEVEKAKENAKVFALKYEAGLATSLDAKKATIDLEQAEENLSESIYLYNTLKSSFKYGIFDTGSGNSDASMAASGQ